MTDSPIIVGEITGVSGVKGWVKVFSHTEPRLNIIKYNPWLIQQGGGEWRSLELLGGRAQGKTIVAHLAGINDRELALTMAGSKIAILPSQLQKLDAEEYYWRELEGLSVVDQQDKVLGRVSHLIETGANDVMVVIPSADTPRDVKAKEIMIPYLMGSVIKKVDLKARQITVDWDENYL